MIICKTCGHSIDAEPEVPEHFVCPHCGAQATIPVGEEALEEHRKRQEKMAADAQCLELEGMWEQPEPAEPADE